MTQTVRAYLEVGKKRAFAGAVAWPGWCRAARDPDAALVVLAAYAPRYAQAIGAAGGGGSGRSHPTFRPVDDVTGFTVVERLDGNTSTDFGVPEAVGAFDDVDLDEQEAARQLALLQSCWATFDDVAERHAGVELRKGPRGGGRSVEKIVGHVLGGEAGYLTTLGGRHKLDEEAPPTGEMGRVRQAAVEVFQMRVRGEPPPRAGRKLWPLRYWIRRSAWHALDHAWEIEDRAP
jgi:hypothetical protein